MPSTREIRRRIRSVRNLAQITRAMEMVSASKMRRAQRNVLATRPYADRLRDVMSSLMEGTGGSHKGTLLEVRAEVKNVALILITPDRGLAGSLVANILRRTARFIIDEKAKGRNVKVLAIGKKGRDFLNRSGQDLLAEVTKLGDNPKLADILGVSTNVIQGFLKSEFDEAYIVYSQFVNTLVQRPAVRRILPVEADQNTTAPASASSNFNYEPDEDVVLKDLLPRFAEVQIYQALLEAIASEHSARMVAMRNATDNAKDLRRELSLTYNKTRQANITKEVSEIASGAVALADS